MADLPRLFTRDFLLLIAGHFLQALGFSSLLLFPLYVDHLGASRSELGAIMAFASLAGMVFRPAVAWALDSLGRKPTLLIGTAFLVTGMGLIAFVDDLGVMIYIDRLAVGIGIAALFTGYFTWASDLIPAERRTEGMAIFGVSGLLPVGINAFVHEIGFEPSGLRYFFPMVGAVIALSFIFILMLQEPAKSRARQQSGSGGYQLRDVLRALRQMPLLSSWLATFLFSGLVGLFMTYVTVTAESRLSLADGSMAGGFFSQPASLWLPYALAAISVRLFGGRLPDRIGPHNLIAPALAVYVSAFLLVAAASEPYEFLIAGGLAGFGHGYCFPVLISQVVSRSPERWRGSAIAFYTALFGLTELILVPVFGGIADRHGDSTLYTSATVGSLVCLVLWCVLEHRWGSVALASSDL